ncbi:protein kinase [Tothia fuscella]|uniref:EKC/KEOPS complex subunit BUD32 n=1 Tax=Tothia fuscella TaxID=1048955 RepID=A0A9P4NG22_9PEZI|nr:protein kinase [Tothia fuscella]
MRTFATDGFGHVSLQDKFEEEKVPDYHSERFYPVLAKLGFGTSSTVWLCRDLEKNIYVVLKVCITGNRNFLRVALDDFQLHGPNGSHQCLLFTPLGLNFSRLRSRFPANSIPKQLGQHSLQVLLVGLDFLHQVDVVHTDLSPNNILLGLKDSSVLSDIEKMELEQPSHRKILPDRTIHMSHTMPITGGLPIICDFGSARVGTKHSGDVMPGQYRAPEVIMGMEWDTEIDIWALGLIIWDIAQGKCLFNAAKDGLLNDERHLAEMVALIGPPPRAFLKRSENCRKYWDSDGNWIAATPIPHKSFEMHEKRFNGKDQELFLQLLRKILRWLPEERPTAEDLYKDEFIYQDRVGVSCSG